MLVDRETVETEEVNIEKSSLSLRRLRVARNFEQINSP